jgi:signal transduction histidine kinase
MSVVSASRVGWFHGGKGDAVLAVVVGVFVVLTTVIGDLSAPVVRSVPPLGWVLMIIGSVAVAFRRRYSVAVAVITLAVSMTYYPLMDADGGILVTLLIALYTLASEGLLVAAATISLVAVLGSAYGEYGSDASPIGDAGLFLLISWLVAVVALGGVAHGREANRDEALRRRATDERLRIARELHDVLGHNISLINVQAAAALHGLHRDSGHVAEALAAIKETSHEALRELRSTLGVLRQVDEQAPTEPAPSLSALKKLVAGTEAIGLGVDVVTEGEARSLPAAVNLAAYRIVQEALTNVTRHAGATRVVIRIRYGRDDVAVEVEDDGRGSSGIVGNGIRGMTERAHAVGGSLEAGGRPEGGFRVFARLPYLELR